MQDNVQVFHNGVELSAPEGEEWVAVYKSILLTNAEVEKTLVTRIETLTNRWNALAGVLHGVVDFVDASGD